MPTIDLSSYEPAPAADLDANQIKNAFALIQSVINGLDANNWAAGKIFPPDQIEQAAATDGQALIWNATDGKWEPTTLPAQAFAQLSDSKLAVDGASFDITPISASYNHLRVVLAGRLASAGALYPYLRFNNDAAANYDYQESGGQSPSSSFSVNAAAANQIRVGRLPVSTDTASYAGTIVIDIPDYASTALYKTVQVQWGGLSGATYYAGTTWGIWKSTAAITRLTLLPSSGNWLAGTRCSLYGIK